MKINRVTPVDHTYLVPLTHIPDPPRVLFYKGKLPESRLPSVAIVGTRKPTLYGKEVTQQLAYDLAEKGVVIISGLALGVDSISHQAALKAGGTTIAVLANSVDRIYPRNHISLARSILDNNGVIMSEYEPPTEARSFQFLARNRIVSGLADAVIIVEAASRSGTLATAAHALAQGRDVLVVPGNITSPLSKGCNNLLKQGAHPITCAEDVLEIIAPQLLTAQVSLPLGATPLETKMLQLLQSGIRDGEELQAACKVSAHEFSQALTLMELEGVIKPLGGNQWTLRR